MSHLRGAIMNFDAQVFVSEVSMTVAIIDGVDVSFFNRFDGFDKFFVAQLNESGDVGIGFRDHFERCRDRLKCIRERWGIEVDTDADDEGIIMMADDHSFTEYATDLFALIEDVVGPFNQKTGCDGFEDLMKGGGSDEGEERLIQCMVFDEQGEKRHGFVVIP